MTELELIFGSADVSEYDRELIAAINEEIDSEDAGAESEADFPYETAPARLGYEAAREEMLSLF